MLPGMCGRLPLTPGLHPSLRCKALHYRFQTEWFSAHLSPTSLAAFSAGSSVGQTQFPSMCFPPPDESLKTKRDSLGPFPLLKCHGLSLMLAQIFSLDNHIHSHCLYRLASGLEIERANEDILSQKYPRK